MPAITDLRSGIRQIGATNQNKELDERLLRALMDAELQSEERIAERNKQWELIDRKMKIEEDAARASGKTQLAGTLLTGGLLLKDTALGKSAMQAVKTGGEYLKNAVTGKEAVAGTGVSPGNAAVTGGVAGALTAKGVTQMAIGSEVAHLASAGESALAAGVAEGSIASGAGAELAYGAGTQTATSSAITGSSQAAATGFKGLGTGIGGLATGAVAGFGAKYLVSDVLDLGDRAGDVIGGATAGFMIGGPVGGLVGGAIGFAVDLVEDASVICTELHRQGHLPDVILALDTIHCKRNIDCFTYIGYRSWADTVVKWMQNSELVTRIAKPIARAWAYEMASRIDSNIKGNLLGKALLKIGVPICRYLGKKKVEGAVWVS